MTNNEATSTTATSQVTSQVTSLWCGFTERKSTFLLPTDTYAEEHVKAFHTQEVKETTEGPNTRIFKREICHQNNLYRETDFKKVRDEK